MSPSDKRSHLKMHIAALLLALPGIACAVGDSSLTSGSGPDGYRSYTFRGDADLTRTVQLNLDYFMAKSTGEDYMREAGAGLTWYATELVSANYRYSDINDGRVEVKGNEGGLSLALDTLWQGELRTAVDFGYGAFKYRAANPQIPAAADFSLTQNRSSFGLSQDLSPSFTLYGSHDQYKYDRDVVGAARLLLRKFHLAAAFRLLAFPDKTNTLGMTWKTTDAISLDFSSAKTTTLLEQEQKSTKLGVDFQINSKLSIAAAITRVSATAVYGPLGGTLQQATQDTYSEFSLGWGF